ncbi:MAG: Hpt domain-containing protein [Phycisphaeraceae bacterium]|nr:Hpt domain-containing protein [Phycisphaeraceae bacterium]
MADSKHSLLYSEYEDDPDMRELVEQFVAEMPERRAELLRAASSGDLSGAIRVAHQLKGASGGYGFGPLGETACQCEEAFKRLDTETDRVQAEMLLRVAEPLLVACDRVRVSSAA